MDAQPCVLLDEYGQPLNARLQAALAPLAARLRHHFPTLTDACTVTEILEESGRRIAAREARKGPLDHLPRYAWVVVRRMAALRLRHDELGMAGAAVSDTVLASVASGYDTSEQIEARILIHQLLAQLTTTERNLLKAKHRGLSMEEMARVSSTSRLSMFNAWRRLKRKLGSLGHKIDSGATRSARLDWKKSSLL